MDPKQFRETRIKINTLCDKIEDCAAQKDAETSQQILEQANTILEALTPQAEGTIQKRSVKNLNLKIKFSENLVKKIKPAKQSGARRKSGAAKQHIDWDADKLISLSSHFLTGVIKNMGTNEETTIRFSAVGKGVRPSYQVYKPGEKPAPFSGSSHNPLKNRLPESPEKLSSPFPRSVIANVFKKVST